MPGDLDDLSAGHGADHAASQKVPGAVAVAPNMVARRGLAKGCVCPQRTDTRGQRR